MVPLKRTGSCRMMERRERRVCRGSLAMSMPSMMMRPMWRRCHKSGTGGAAGGAVWDMGPSEDGRETVLAGPPVMSEHTPALRSPLVAVGGCAVPAIPLTFERVHHAEEGEREGGLPTARAATDPDLGREGPGLRGRSGAGSGGAQVWEAAAGLAVPVSDGILFVGLEGAPTGTHKTVPGRGCRPACAWSLAAGELGARVCVCVRAAVWQQALGWLSTMCRDVSACPTLNRNHL